MDDGENRIQKVRVEKLHFDPDNPRLPSTVNGANERDVLRWMLDSSTIVELMGSIGEEGYFAGEPLLVVPHRVAADEFEAVEGNRRLTAVKLLHNPELAPTKQKAVRSVSEGAKEKPVLLPVIVYPNRGAILQYLGYRHITGIKPWGALAKAKYLAQLVETMPSDDYEEQCRVAAKAIGSRTDYVARLRTGLAIYEQIAHRDFFDIPNLGEDTFTFSVLTTALSYENIAQFLGLESGGMPDLSTLDLKRLKELTAWLFDREGKAPARVAESRSLGRLSDVVANEKALQAFRNGVTLDEAYLLSEGPTGTFRSAVGKARGQLQAAINQFHLVEVPSQEDANALDEIFRMVRDLRSAVKNRLLDAEEP